LVEDERDWRQSLVSTHKIASLLLFLPQGFEDLEAVAILDVFGWTQYREEIKKASVITTGFHGVVRSRFGLEIKPDIMFEDIIPKNYKALVVPGGFHGYGFEEAYDPRIYQVAQNIHANGGYIATMCVGILPIADSGLLKGKKATTYPFSRNHDNIARLEAGGATVVNEPVVIDDRIISCNGPGSSLDVAFLLMECLLGLETARKVRHYMMYK
jgi:4-methyl-5(b-hydroxyethyl)-thiazole monophosphate biosynthesis